MAERRTTTDHEAIRGWVEARGGIPSHALNTLPGDAAGALYIDFPGWVKKDVSETTWEIFFKTFDRENLAFAYEDGPPDADPTTLCALVDRETGESVQA